MLKLDRDEVTASVELAVQLVGFKNIDLFSQGIYQLRISAHGSHSGRQAVPFAVLAAPREANSQVPDQVLAKEDLLPAHILDATGEFCSPSFRVRYCEEEVSLRTMVRFRVDLSFLDAGFDEERPSLGESMDGMDSGLEQMILTVKLMHARSTTRFDLGDDLARLEAESARHFSVAATQALVITMPLPTVSAMFPVTFSDWHFCCTPPLITNHKPLQTVQSVYAHCLDARPLVLNTQLLACSYCRRAHPKCAPRPLQMCHSFCTPRRSRASFCVLPLPIQALDEHQSEISLQQRPI